MCLDKLRRDWVSHGKGLEDHDAMVEDSSRPTPSRPSISSSCSRLWYLPELAAVGVHPFTVLVKRCWRLSPSAGPSCIHFVQRSKAACCAALSSATALAFAAFLNASTHALLRSISRDSRFLQANSCLKPSCCSGVALSTAGAGCR